MLWVRNVAAMKATTEIRFQSSEWERIRRVTYVHVMSYHPPRPGEGRSTGYMKSLLHKLRFHSGNVAPIGGVKCVCIESRSSAWRQSVIYGHVKTWARVNSAPL